jgi:hypothetical protein
MSLNQLGKLVLVGFKEDIQTHERHGSQLRHWQSHSGTSKSSTRQTQSTWLATSIAPQVMDVSGAGDDACHATPMNRRQILGESIPACLQD